MEMNVHELRLPETDDFSKRFNYVGQLYDKWNDPALSKEDQDKWFKEYMSAKYCLEQGLPICFIDLTSQTPTP